MDDVTDILWILYYLKQIDYIFPCVCAVTDHRKHKNAVRALVLHSAIASRATFLISPHSDVSINRRKIEGPFDSRAKAPAG